MDIAKAPLTLKHNALALLFVHGPTLCLTTRSSQSTGPPSVLASWTVFNLRRFGVLESKFCFQVNDVDGGCCDAKLLPFIMVYLPITLVVQIEKFVHSVVCVSG